MKSTWFTDSTGRRFRGPKQRFRVGDEVIDNDPEMAVSGMKMHGIVTHVYGGKVGVVVKSLGPALGGMSITYSPKNMRHLRRAAKRHTLRKRRHR